MRIHRGESTMKSSSYFGGDLLLTSGVKLYHNFILWFIARSRELYVRTAGVSIQMIDSPFGVLIRFCVPNWVSGGVVIIQKNHR